MNHFVTLINQKYPFPKWMRNLTIKYLVVIKKIKLKKI